MRGLGTNGTGAGGNWQDRYRLMEIYDSLPPEVRDAIANSPFAMGAASLAGMLRRYDAKEVASIAEQFVCDSMNSGDANNLGHDESTRRYWGADHPQHKERWSYRLRPWRTPRRVTKATEVRRKW